MISEGQPRLFGLGLRKPHYRQFAEGSVPVDFVEVISENFMVEGGRPLVTLSRVREHYPVALHGVSMSLGSVSGLNDVHLDQLQLLIDRVDPLFVSDHLCWTGYEEFNSHDLLPLPYTDEALSIVGRNIVKAQERLDRQILIENPTSYVTFDHSSMTEWEFIRELTQHTGCGLLLDVNNVFVSAMNHGFDALHYLEALRGCDVRQIHLAGHDDTGSLRIDTHDRDVCAAVWELYCLTIALFPQAATMIERDDEIPPIEWLLAELNQARSIAGRAAALVS
ncbi:DUF692 domain-containing protein [Sphingomonas sp. RB56-2]|uniref:DUF692 domain-containing protein n=1 Tax=Sphingomonas brevis TaxID=2908206 RepID=A0ABT0SAL4_9SPHN|nr:DUF692 domain-containing protein [Sphingomonas brevis]MCL6741436.1 DUF692 domain-containing protein [Sphingomonas brevis]